MAIHENRDFVNRFGIIKFSHMWLREVDVRDRRAIYQKITPIRSHYAEVGYDMRQDVLVCYSELFRELGEGERFPEYEVILNRDEEGNVTIESVKEITK